MTTAALIGPGRAGTLLATALARAGARLVAVAGGTSDARERVASLVAGARPLDDPVAAAAAAELVVLAVPDRTIETVADALAIADVCEGRRLVHVAGALGVAPLRRASLAGARVAACHPAMTIPEGATDPASLVGAAWAVTARPADRAWAHELVTMLGGDPHDVDEDVRALYHAGLTVGSNAVGAAVATARQLLLAAGIDRPASFLAPLVAPSVANVLERGAAALTGPVVRGDAGTIAGHLAVLCEVAPELLDAYRALLRAVLAQARSRLDPAVADELEAILDPGHGGAAPAGA